MILANTDAMLEADTPLETDKRRTWWFASQTAHERRRRVKTRWLAAAAVALLVLGAVGFLVDQQNRRVSLRAQLLETLTNRDFAGLARLSGEHRYAWSEIPSPLGTFLDKVDPEVFATDPWIQERPNPTELLDVIERGHSLFVPSRPLFGAMSFALEEVFLRNPEDSGVRERARALSEEVRAAFIAYHREQSPAFQPPPSQAEDDAFNTWVTLPADEFVMGSQDGSSDERPPHPVRLSGFSMQQHEVTNQEYRRFDPSHEFPAGEEQHPAANVTWYAAAAYAAWLGASLPTEAQWEYAARGTGATKGRIYPWGDAAPDQSRTVFGGTSTMPVGSHPLGRTPEGLDDMAGNVWEWCRDWYGPYGVQDASDPLGPIAADADRLGGVPARVLRGGSFGINVSYLRAASRGRDDPGFRGGYIGFRVVSSRLRP
jgi:formylglycine-generating enzyme required for sulfatase activity